VQLRRVLQEHFVTRPKSHSSRLVLQEISALLSPWAAHPKAQLLTTTTSRARCQAPFIHAAMVLYALVALLVHMTRPAQQMLMHFWDRLPASSAKQAVTVPLAQATCSPARRAGTALRQILHKSVQQELTALASI
jgi:hypothetical protein